MLQYNTIFLYIHIGRDKNIYYTFNHKKLTFVNKLNLNKNWLGLKIQKNQSRSK